MNMRLAIMQPYLLPYIGYFQLMAAVDRFVLYDDVNYIQRGWVNRNRVLLNGHAHRFTMPLQDASQNRLICETRRCDDPAWAQRLLRTLHQAYARAPRYPQVAPLLEDMLCHPALVLSDYLRYGLQSLHHYMGLRCELVPSSQRYGNAQLKGQARILDICKREDAESYINAIGGAALYDRELFAQQGVQLSFLQPRPTRYAQWSSHHLPWLSIVDVLMFNSPAQLSALLADADLV